MKGMNSPAVQIEDDDLSSVQVPALPTTQNSNDAVFTILNTDSTYQDAWWMADSADDYMSKIHVSDECVSKLVELRDVDSITGNTFAHTCGRYRLTSINFPKSQFSLVLSMMAISATFLDRKSTRLNSSHRNTSRMPSSA